MSARDEARLLGTAFSGGYGGGGYPMGGRSRLVDLIMARGQQQAEAARASGDLWGNAINSIGQNISGAIQQYGEEQKIKKRDAAWLGVLNDPAVMSDPKALYIKSTEVWGPQDGPKMFQGVAGAAQLMQPKRDPERDAKALPAVGAAYLKLGPEARPAVYPQIRAMIRGAFPDIQMPEQHDPAFDEKVVAPFIQGLQPAPEFMTGAPGSGIVNKSTGQITGTVPDRPAAPPKPPEVGSFGDYLTRTYGEKPTPQQIIAARKAYGQADDRARVTVMNMGGDYQLSDQGIDIAALNYRKTGTLPPIARDPAALKRIVDRAATLTPNDVSRIESGGMDVATNKAAYGADAGSLKKLQQQTDAVAAFESTATANSKIMSDMVKKIPDLGTSLLNAPVRSLSGKLGSEDMARFNTIRQSVANEYARIISNPTLAGTMSDSARKEASVLLDPNATVGQIQGALETLAAEAKNRHRSYQDQLGAIRGRMGGNHSTAAPGTVGRFKVEVE